MPPRPKKTDEASNLTTFRIDAIEKRQSEHEIENRAKHEELDEKIVNLRLELMKIVVKVGIAGYALGSIGSYMLQEFGGK